MDQDTNFSAREGVPDDAQTIVDHLNPELELIEAIKRHGRCTVRRNTSFPEMM